MNRCTIAAVFAILLCAGTALAQGGAGSGSLRVEASAENRATGGNNSRAVADPRVFAMIEDTHRTAPNGFTEASAKEIVAIVLEDGVLDPEEYDLLDELTQGKIRVINITAKGTNKTHLVGVQHGAVQRMLAAPLDEHVNKLLANPPTQASWAAFVDRYEYSGSSAARVVESLVRRIAAKWQDSNIGNAYGPYSDAVSALFGLCKALPAEKQTPARWLLNRACKQHDNARRDAVPDFLYSYVRPNPMP
ncbi:MAG: hypothetical protein ACKO5K_02625 [Armatimonadota bacterium]